MFGERKSYSGLNPKDSGEELWITYKRKKCANPSSDSRGVSKISGGVRNAQEHLITYKRRRCANPGSDFGGVAVYSKRCRDIGWDHGTMIDGNKNHWKCNWCGLVRYGGGSCRLKQHLVKCVNAPNDVSKAIENYMMMKRERKSRRSCASDGANIAKSRCSDYMLVDKDGPLVDSMKEVGSHSQLFKKASKQSRIYPYQSKSSTQRLQATTHLYENSVAKVAVYGLNKRRCRDIGWQHGTMIDGNSNHWKCNWCGLVRYGGGLSRLKRHLVECPSVPNEVYKAVKNYMRMKRERKLRLAAASDGTDNAKSRCSDYMVVDKDGPLVNSKEEAGRRSQLFEKTSKQLRIHPYQSKSSTQRPQATTHLSDNSVAVGNMEEHHGAVLQKNTSEQDGCASTDSHWTRWKYVLENMLQLPDVCESGGVRSCICDALTMGHSGLTKRLEVSDISRNTEQPQDRFEGYEMHTTAASGISKPTSEADTLVNSTKCQSYLVDILCSENFALLCDLLWRTFEDNKTKGFFDFSIINAKMKNGDYGRAPGLIDQDIQQAWEKVKEVGRKMIHLAECLSNMSSASSQKQAGEVSKLGVNEHKTQKNCAIVVEQKNSVKSNTCNLDHSAKVNQTKPSSLHKTSASQQCSAKANGKESHFSCPNSATKLKPIRSSHFTPYCTNKREPPKPISMTYVRKDSLNQSCAAYDKLEDDSQANDSRVSSVSNIELDEARTSISRLCKLCGTCEEENKRFLVCRHIDCPYKFYHIRCLNSRQIASTVPWNIRCWLCPSCLCRACLSDKDDDKILLCDGCEEAYHIYCVDLPRDLVPTGEWYCVRCNAQREREVLRSKQGIFKRHRISNDVEGGNESTCGVDLLLSAAEKLKFEENMRGRDKSKKGHHCTHFVKP
ncbi:PHD finger protein EHD3-like isoform X1 [Ananas comosus]|uniref:PHD finger protein EHD3-like isoform X1 n=1 Tax=Ananas comosus TaxID=4615 RepID=A0A6P5FJT1_ANACO|nr:PHD finger protein EHD3-like isoform X1 [Ananas comosus]